MNKTLTLLIAAATTMGGHTLTSCGNASADTGTTKTVKTEGIETVELETTLLSGSRAYSFTSDGETGYATTGVSAEWPRKIGNTSLTALTDTLTSAAFGEKGKGVESAITDFLTNTSDFTTGTAEDIPAGDIPSDKITLSKAVNITRSDLTTKYVTYMVTSEEYLGGAHGMTIVNPVTYDLTTSSIVTPATLFKAGSDSTIIDAITNNLAMMLGTDPAQLGEAGITTTPLPMPSAMYLNSYGQIVFQYGQYEIGPGSMGIISVPVNPFQLRDVLTAQGNALLN